MKRNDCLQSALSMLTTTAACAATAALLTTTAAPAHAGEVILLQMTIDGSQENPPVDSASSGTGTAVLDLNRNELSWTINFNVGALNGSETAAHFHGNAPYCANAGVQITLSSGSPKVGSQVLTTAQVDAILDGLWYVNIHSTGHPGGEIRGQLLPMPLPNPVGTIAQSDLHVQLETVADGLTAPHSALPAPGIADRLYVVDQDGTVWNVNLNTRSRTLFMDISDVIVELGAFGPGSFDERGLLGVAFHPDYASNGLLYTYTSEPVDGPADYSTIPAGESAHHQSVIREWTVADPTNPDATVDTSSSRELLRVDQPQFNHNAGVIQFGPDGMLFIAFGDGGNADDQGLGHVCIGNAQDTTSPLGSILRIDPLGSNGPNGEYGIPDDNPFVGEGSTLEETYAYGLRNPWRMSFDAMTGELYVGDVGQNDIEEVNIVNAGDNLGWGYKEGNFFFIKNGASGGYITDVPISPASGVSGPFVDPVAEYHNNTDGIAVVAGFVYRGDRAAFLQGHFILGDWSLGFGTPNGRLFHMDPGHTIRELQLVDQDSLGLFLAGFGTDHDGEHYLLGNTTGTPFEDTGVVLRIAPVTGDFDGTGTVDGADLAVLLGAWGPCNDCDNCPADLDGNCMVDGADLAILLGNWS